ncbi:threonylcarbamoyl-AMP synthase [Candidatus Curtissbacteria bacterium RIFCSPLOWO2_02_FULL_40_11]|uniref:L-threonylcarbamoyladenylate synthase n=2 Tax=Candidatus Curtissiibacteriota TaxID=1752717 RepID=A0A1F5GBW5_9BACT|nr:MAG: threonylcarbamoyl-AMP synthase [Candidatus Curtissbacteria bacterium RIFCSPHIGHO2_02_FULL_40_16b]OGE01051.1 MAG: threonylcarbamoyl-AMP synthase [Candidatus Curtissbacteria bacterium RIFCSPLOWO2_02_FULL_40_11]OGE12318.1 MAG: threonylcarbamoyl-AMP synthase [Candidatus Curtissbacteria bacterium RIFCSPLOWO2_12_FULL_38_9]
MKNHEESQSKEIEQAVKILRSGGVVIFPTDTVYGIGCRYDFPHSVQRIKNIKKSTQNFPVLIVNINQAHKLANMTPSAMHLVNKHWPGGLTILVHKKSDEEKIGLRIPASDLVISIINRLQVPIIGTSANFHRQPSVTKFENLDERLVKLADYVIKGECIYKVESTVVDATVNPVKILREGLVKIR